MTTRSSQQNGVIERKSRTLLEAARNIAVDTTLPTFLWEELICASSYLQHQTFMHLIA